MHPPFKGPFFLPTPTSFSPAPAPCFPIQISGQQLLPQSSSDSLCFLASFFICFHCKCHGTFRSGGVGEARTCRRDVMMIATPQLTGDGERPCCCPLFRTGAERPAEPPPDPVGHPGKKSVVATAGAAACRWMHGRLYDERSRPLLLISIVLLSGKSSCSCSCQFQISSHVFVLFSLYKLMCRELQLAVSQKRLYRQVV